MEKQAICGSGPQTFVSWVPGLPELLKIICGMIPFKVPIPNLAFCNH